MTPEQLKGSIIQSAILGKLVAQLDSDSSVDEALLEMREARDALIQSGKLKKEGKINKKADVEIEIPTSWRLVPLRELVCKRVDNRGKTPPHSLSKNPIEYIDLLEIASIIPGKSIDHSKVEKFVAEETYNQQRGFVEKDDILIATVGSIGKFALMDDTKSAVAQNIIAIKCFDKVDQHYIFYLLQSPYFYFAMGCIKMEAVQASIKVPDLMNLNVPLPPIEEQQRIVAKIEELLPFVDRYAEAYEKLEKFNVKFPEDMKKSILQYAIQGRLVEQRAEEGTAEELYQQIQEEKQKLIKEGKIKKEKPLADITDDEIPFDIPESWKWVRLGDCVSILGDGLHGTPTYSVGGEYFFINGNNLSNGNIKIKSDTKRVSYDEYEKYKKELYDNTVLVSINGTIGNVAFYSDEKVILGKSACYFNLIDKAWKEYIYWIIKTDYFLKYATTNATGSTIKNVSLATMKSFLIPLPPLEEQKRIVAKIEELLPFCDQLIK